MNPNSTSLVPKEYFEAFQATDIATALFLSKSEKCGVNLKQNFTTKTHGSSNNKEKKIRRTNNFSGPFDVCNAESMRNDFLLCLEDYKQTLGIKLCPVGGIEIYRQDISHRTIVDGFRRRRVEETTSRELKGKTRQRASIAVF